MTETPAQEWPSGDGEMARLVRAHEWSNTPVGPIDAWPQSLRSAVDIVLGSPMAMIVLWGPELIQIYNDAYRMVMGRKHPAGLGQPTHACWPEVRDFTAPTYAAVLRGEARTFKNQKLALERDLAPRDGWFDLTYSPVRDEAGAVSGVLATVIETTERQRADEALRESEARFRALVTAGAYAVYHMSPDWTEMRGLYGKGFISDTRGPTKSWLEKYIHPADRDRVLAAVREAIRAKEIFELEHRVSRGDGTVGWTFSRAVPLLDEDGEITEWFGAASDITARKRAEEALRESEQGFRAIANLVPDLLWSNDPSGATAWYNDRFLDYTGQSLQEARGDGWLAIIHPDDRARSLANYQAAVDEGRPLVQQHRVRRRDGQYRWFLIRAEPVRDEAGRIVRWFGAATDIHDMRKLQDEQKILVAELQHRTRNLLAVVQSVMRQTVRASASLEDFDRRFAGRLAALGRAQEMLARAEGEPVTIQELAHVELTAHGAEPDGERVVLDGPPVELPRRGLETLALAVHELATNAVKYGALSLPAGRLTIIWTLSAERAGKSRLLTLEWCEAGVEMPDPDIGQRRRGFGQELIERALPYQLNAETELEFTPGGVRCRILMPLH